MRIEGGRKGCITNHTVKNCPQCLRPLFEPAQLHEVSNGSISAISLSLNKQKRWEFLEEKKDQTLEVSHRNRNAASLLKQSHNFLVYHPIHHCNRKLLRD